MSLIDDLRKIGPKLPPSHVPSLNELAGVVGASIAHLEHGESIVAAAENGAEEVAKLLAPIAADVVEAAVPAAAPVVAEVEKVVAAEGTAKTEAETVAELRKQLEAVTTELANYQRTRLAG